MVSGGGPYNSVPAKIGHFDDVFEYEIWGMRDQDIDDMIVCCVGCGR